MTSTPSISASPIPDQPAIVRYLDVVLLVLGAPIMLLIGVSAAGYCIATGVWILLRAAGIGVERASRAIGNPNRAIGLSLGYMLGRLFALALTIILVRRDGGRDAGLAALLVIVFAFTTALGISALTRPRSR